MLNGAYRLEHASGRYLSHQNKHASHSAFIRSSDSDTGRAIKPLTQEKGVLCSLAPERCAGSRPMSDMALLAALRRMGIDKSEMTIHEV